ncbi:MAG: Cof-type HAD-IIB family hydrolase [Treponema sp.]|nr:Cof-type HAD-IIB family hydrolase [Treponema sp.]
MGKKLVCLDIDGTLLGLDGVVPASAIDACLNARRNGHRLYICSGRNMMEVNVNREILDIGFDGIASSGGAHIEIDGTVVFDAAIPAETVREIYLYMNGLGFGIALEKNDAILSNKHNIAHWEAVLENFEGHEKQKRFARLLDTKMKNPLPEIPEARHYENINKIVFNCKSSGCFAEVRRMFGQDCEIFESSIPFSVGEGGEIGRKGVHKGSALKRIAEHHGIAIADTIAFGDSDNDRPMIEAAGVGVAMGNASDSLKAIAGMVTTSLDDDGILNGFRKLELI